MSLASFIKENCGNATKDKMLKTIFVTCKDKINKFRNFHALALNVHESQPDMALIRLNYVAAKLLINEDKPKLAELKKLCKEEKIVFPLLSRGNVEDPNMKKYLSKIFQSLKVDASEHQTVPEIKVKKVKRIHKRNKEVTPDSTTDSN